MFLNHCWIILICINWLSCTFSCLLIALAWFRHASSMALPSRQKYFDNHWMNCHSIWYKYVSQRINGVISVIPRVFSLTEAFIYIVKYLHIYKMDWHKQKFPEDESCWLWLPPKFSSSATMKFIFTVFIECLDNYIRANIDVLINDIPISLSCTFVLIGNAY